MTDFLDDYTYKSKEKNNHVKACKWETNQDQNEAYEVGG